MEKITGGIFGGRERSPATRSSQALDAAELGRIGTPEDPLHGYEEALERNFAAMEAEQRGEVDRAIALYEESVAGEFVESHPYERLAGLYERKRSYDDARRVLEAFIGIARSGKLPRGAQRSADRRLPDIEERAARCRRMSGERGG